MDHLVPKSWGGSNDPSNLVAMCEPCNGEKASVGLYEFLRRHPEVRERLGPLIDRSIAARPVEEPFERQKEVEVEVEVASLPSVSEALDGEGKFVCPIFEEACPLAERRKARKHPAPATHKGRRKGRRPKGRRREPTGRREGSS